MQPSNESFSGWVTGSINTEFERPLQYRREALEISDRNVEWFGTDALSLCLSSSSRNSGTSAHNFLDCYIYPLIIYCTRIGYPTHFKARKNNFTSLSSAIGTHTRRKFLNLRVVLLITPSSAHGDSPQSKSDELKPYSSHPRAVHWTRHRGSLRLSSTNSGGGRWV